MSLDGFDIVLVGFFSAKQKDYAERMDAAAQAVAARGGRVVARFVQRRGVSSGGVGLMSREYSARTLLSAGKVREVTQACADHSADAVVFVNPLTERQRRVLTRTFGRPAVSLASAGRVT